MLSCRAENAAYQVSSGGGSDSSAPGTTTSAPPESTSGSASATTPTGPTGGASTGGTGESGSSGNGHEASGTALDTGTDSRCWSTPITIITERLIPAGTLLPNVPVKVETSSLHPAVPDLETLRFYQGDELLPHELEGPGRFAWVRVAEITGGAADEIHAVIGANCPDVRRLPQRAVWSAGYVAVFHFDEMLEAPLRFVDSVDGIELLADENTEPSAMDWSLGPYARKFGNGRLEAVDASLDLGGTSPLSTLGWVELERGEADVLLWNGEDARHRELISKLPGYRLNAVRGETGPDSMVLNAPFFNLAESLVDSLHDNVAGTDPVGAETWTMLSGVYNGTVMQLFVDDEFVAGGGTEYTPGTNGGALRVGRWLRGGVDEIRVSDVARSQEWLRVQHASMTATLLQYGETQEH